MAVLKNNIIHDNGCALLRQHFSKACMKSAGPFFRIFREIERIGGCPVHADHNDIGRRFYCPPQFEQDIQPEVFFISPAKGMRLSKTPVMPVTSAKTTAFVRRDMHYPYYRLRIQVL